MKAVRKYKTKINGSKSLERAHNACFSQGKTYELI